MCFACGCHLAWRAYRIKTFRNNQITVKVASFVAVVEFGVVLEASNQARQARVQVSTNERLCASVARKPLEDVLARQGCQRMLYRRGRVDIVNIDRLCFAALPFKTTCRCWHIRYSRLAKVVRDPCSEGRFVTSTVAFLTMLV